jgi:hypothetical protein
MSPQPAKEAAAEIVRSLPPRAPPEALRRCEPVHNCVSEMNPTKHIVQTRIGTVHDQDEDLSLAIALDSVWTRFLTLQAPRKSGDEMTTLSRRRCALCRTPSFRE